jgi:hypothetical protein
MLLTVAVITATVSSIQVSQWATCARNVWGEGDTRETGEL